MSKKIIKLKLFNPVKNFQTNLEGTSCGCNKSQINQEKLENNLNNKKETIINKLLSRKIFL